MEFQKANNAEIFAATKIMKTKAIRINNSNDSSEVMTSAEISLLRKHSTSRGRLILELLQMTALRISEALRLPAKLDSKGEYLQATIVGKAGIVRNVFIPARLHKEIIETFKGRVFLLESRNGKPLNRAAVFRMVKESARKAIASGEAQPSLLGKAKLHGLRHSWAHMALQKNVPLHTISEFLGHRSIETTVRHYIKQRPNPIQILTVYEGNAA